MAIDNPFQRPSLATIGDTDPDKVRLAVGGALEAWEHAERGFAHIFSKLVHPVGSGFAARRAYGTIIATFVRRQMIEAAAQVFFRNFPNEVNLKELADLMELYSAATGRRNDFGHGVVGGDRVKGQFWHFLVPNTWGSKSRNVRLEIDYRYSSKQIREFTLKFQELGGRAIHLFDALDEMYKSAPAKARAPY